MNKQIIVSRFNEVPDVYCKIFDLIQNFEVQNLKDFQNLQSKKSFFSKTSLYFYNKGKPLELGEFERLQSYGFKNIDYIELPNVGREAHTMIYHMRSKISGSKTERSEDLIYFIPASFSRKLKPKTERSESVSSESSVIFGPDGLYTEDAVVQVLTKNIILLNNPCFFGVEAGFMLDDWKGTDPDNLKDTVKQKYSLAKIRPFGAWFQNLIRRSSESQNQRIPERFTTSDPKGPTTSDPKGPLGLTFTVMGMV